MMNDPTHTTPLPGADLLAAFGAALASHLRQMRAALERGDLAGVQAPAHLLSGSAATFGCRRVGAAAAELEQCCRAADLAASRNALDRLCAAALADAPDAFAADAAAPEATPSAAQAPLILLVDDDALLLGVLKQTLESAGLRVLTACDGASALALLHAGQAQTQLAVLDIALPGMSGLELAAQLEGVPYMFLSASSGPEIAEQAAECGAVGYLVKPIDPTQLLPAVRAALARAVEIQDLRAAEQRLTLALREGRETGMAVGVLMERYRIDRHDALRMLRSHARSRQRKLNDVAVELVQAAEILNSLPAPRPEAPGGRPRTQDRRK